MKTLLEELKLKAVDLTEQWAGQRDSKRRTDFVFELTKLAGREDLSEADMKNLCERWYMTALRNNYLTSLQLKTFEPYLRDVVKLKLRRLQQTYGRVGESTTSA